MNRLFRTSLLLASVVLLFNSCDTLQQAGGIPGTTGTASATPTGSEISSGIKQALQIGLQDGVKQVSAVDGYFKNPLIKILFPPNAQKVESTLRNIGLGNLCDQVELSLNRAAEDAARQAGPIFMNALQKMTLTDATHILLGTDTAATSYFRRATTSELVAKFSPVIAGSLNKVNATRYWSEVTTRYNQLPLVKPVNTDLTAYVTDQAVNGLFLMVAEKEKEIRNQLSARTTPLLKKVFNYAAREQGKR